MKTSGEKTSQGEELIGLCTSTAVGRKSNLWSGNYDLGSRIVVIKK